MTDLLERLREAIIADAFESGKIQSGILADQLTRERHDAADEIERLRSLPAALYVVIAAVLKGGEAMNPILQKAVDEVERWPRERAVFPDASDRLIAMLEALKEKDDD